MMGMFGVLGPTEDSNPPLAENFGLADRSADTDSVLSGVEQSLLQQLSAAIPVDEVHADAGELLIGQAIDSYYTYHYVARALGEPIVMANAVVREAVLGLLRAQGRVAIIDVAGVFDRNANTKSLVQVISRIRANIESSDRSPAGTDADLETIAHIANLTNPVDASTRRYPRSALTISTEFMVHTKLEIGYVKALRNSFAAHPSYALKVDPGKLGVNVDWGIVERNLVLAVNIYDYLSEHFRADVEAAPGVGGPNETADKPTDIGIEFNSSMAMIVRDGAKRKVDALIDGLTSVPGYAAPEVDPRRVWEGAPGRRHRVIKHFGKRVQELFPGNGGVRDRRDDAVIDGINAAVTRLMRNRPVRVGADDDAPEWLLNIRIVAALLDISESEVARRRRSERLVAFKDRRAWVFPASQFVRADPESEEWTVKVDLVDRWWKSHEGSNGWATFLAGERQVSADG
ncbi:hypothetical protein [Rhodococcus sp. KRD162]|jgi:hypothetical protein|uniref:hypothetical protein n=1 Tax=Rhodococcus sp. KRD162 TaxID=2729725 RepID=UPI0019D24349|nr:hypothetical protein [Rhodococcus sp. KRD162]